jgi:hypothetical protein
LQTQNGIEIVTANDVFVPGGNPPSFGVAYVKATAAIAGKQGNIAAWAINQLYGVSLYIRNLTAFHGGRDAYSVKIITAQDRQNAITTARVSVTLSEARSKDFLAYPCSEVVEQKNSRIRLIWACQYVRFAIPSYMHLTTFKLVGKNIIAEVWYVVHPTIIVFK